MEVLCNNYKECKHKCSHKYIHTNDGFCESQICASAKIIVRCDQQEIRKLKLEKLNDKKYI